MKFLIFFVFAVALFEEAFATANTQICSHAYESYRSCSNGCEVSCDNYNDPPICIAACLEERAGCYCNSGYVRSRDGSCVRPEQCKVQTCTRPHEKYQSCSNGCQTTCDNKDNPPICAQICSTKFAGCYCEYPYIRNKNGDCVLESQCQNTPRICLHAHESYHNCSNGCQLTCENYNDPPICIAACLPERAGCYCNSGYVRSRDGSCVRPEQCKVQTCTRPHEKYQSCSNGCQTTCDNKDNPPICAQICSTKFAGCYCEYPYIRNKNGDCVLESQCQKTPRICLHAHESYHNCSNGCQLTCENYNDPPICIAACLPERAGCYCNSGYVRSRDGSCVRPEQCKVQTCNRPHEKYQSCSNSCQTTCDNKDNPPICAQICSTKFAGCYCEYPYIRNKNGDCVLESQCQKTPRICLHAHESYHNCSNGCQLTCENYNDPPICIAACLPERAGCYCNSGYVRSRDGSCVRPEQCKVQTCTRPHEKYQSCSNGCQTTCDNKDNPPICAQICSTKFAGCYCEYPYIRNKNGDCVLESQCQNTPRICLHAHESYHSCSNGCQLTCENYNDPPICIAACLPERAGCYCNSGYVRSRDGSCVRPEQCKVQTCNRPHEKYQSCSNGCQTTCDNKDNPPICAQICSTKFAGCYCEYPYIRNKNGDCVLESQCQKTPRICLHAHESYHNCSNGCQLTCENYNDPPICIAACLPERAGCYCNSGYVRSRDGSCVRPEQCKVQTCTRPHEKYQSCSNGCQTTCDNKNNPPICAQICSTKFAGCYCEYPYIRNKNGDCVLESQCQNTPRICLHAHESYHSCSNGCQLTCENYNDPPICIAACLPEKAGCYCNSGYVRSRDGSCVRPEQCRVQTCTRPHEKYQSCSNGCQTTCDNKNNPPICAQICSTKFAGCYCEYPYIRNKNGDCVLESQCQNTPRICLHAHESYHNCSNGCQLTCENYNDPPICIAACLPERAGCYCNSGYVRSRDGSCVRPEQCKVQTCNRPHEKYQSCSNGCQTTCDNKDNPPICAQICSTKFAGCYCEYPYIRNENGDCVLESQCQNTPRICLHAHESYHNCSNGCQLTCENYNDPPICIAACLPEKAGCYCDSGYVRRRDGRCVRKEQCRTQTCTRPYEKYLSCSNGCEITCDNKDNPPICTKICSTQFAGCYCEYPYIRGENNACVLPSQCRRKIVEPQPPLCGGDIPYCDGANEVYNPTGTLCPRTCATKDMTFKCWAGTQYGCFCAKGYLRNNRNECVRESDC